MTTTSQRITVADGSLDLTSASAAANNKVQFLTITPVAVPVTSN